MLGMPKLFVMAMSAADANEGGGAAADGAAAAPPDVQPFERSERPLVVAAWPKAPGVLGIAEQQEGSWLAACSMTREGLIISSEF
jgi:hypothetical protein